MHPPNFVKNYINCLYTEYTCEKNFYIRKWALYIQNDKKWQKNFIINNIGAKMRFRKGEKLCTLWKKAKKF